MHCTDTSDVRTNPLRTTSERGRVREARTYERRKRGGVYDGRAARARYMAACPDTTFAPPHTHTHGLNDLGKCMVELTCATSAWATCIARCTGLPVRRCVSTNSATTPTVTCFVAQPSTGAASARGLRAPHAGWRVCNANNTGRTSDACGTK